MVDIILQGPTKTYNLVINGVGLISYIPLNELENSKLLIKVSISSSYALTIYDQYTTYFEAVNNNILKDWIPPKHGGNFTVTLAPIPTIYNNIKSTTFTIIESLIPVYTPQPLGIGDKGPPMTDTVSSTFNDHKINKGHAGYFKEDSTLSEEEKKYCSCILKVGAKGSVKNKYAICAHSVGTTSQHCGDNYDYQNLPTPLLIEYATSNKLKFDKTDRQSIINAIMEWKHKEGKI